MTLKIYILGYYSHTNPIYCTLFVHTAYYLHLRAFNAGSATIYCYVIGLLSIFNICIATKWDTSLSGKVSNGIPVYRERYQILYRPKYYFICLFIRFDTLPVNSTPISNVEYNIWTSGFFSVMIMVWCFCIAVWGTNEELGTRGSWCCEEYSWNE